MANLRKRRQAVLGTGGTSLGGTGGDTIAGGTITSDSALSMPDPNNPALAESARLRMERGRREGGRIGTILSRGLRNRLRGIEEI